jgi:hypothetical protein
MAGAVALTIGTALLAGAAITAWVFEGLFAVALIQVVFGDVCGAANLYHVLQRRLQQHSLVERHLGETGRHLVKRASSAPGRVAGATRAG